MTEQATRPSRATVHDAYPKPTKHVHHGRTPAAWAGSILAMVAFFVGGIGFVVHDGPGLVFWIGAALLALSGILTLILQRVGLGAY